MHETKYTCTIYSNYPKESGKKEGKSKESVYPSLKLKGEEFTCPGYIQVGYSYDKNGDIDIELNKEFHIDKNITLYVVWGKEVPLSITFNSNVKEATTKSQLVPSIIVNVAEDKVLGIQERDKDNNTVFKTNSYITLESVKFTNGNLSLLGFAFYPDSISVLCKNGESIELNSIKPMCSFHDNSLATSTSLSLTLYAIWGEKGKYYLTFYDGVGKGAAKKTEEISYINYKDKVKVKLNYAPFTKEGSFIVGYNKTKTTNESSPYLCDYPNNDYITLTGDAELYTVWGESNKKVTITYNGNGGVTQDTGKEEYYQSIVKNDYYSSSSVKFCARLMANRFIKEGYTFKGWATYDKSKVDYSDMATSYYSSYDQTLYAVWEANSTSKTTYTVTFIEDNTAWILNKKTLEVPADDNVISSSELENKVDEWGFSKGNSYRLLGFSTHTTYDFSSGSSGYKVDYPIGTDISVVKDMTLYAEWGKATQVTYKVTFNANGGQGEPFTKEASFNSSYNTYTLTLPYCTFYYDKHNFIGWSSIETPSSYSTIYSPGSVLTVSKDTTLYAIWNLKTLTLSYYLYTNCTPKSIDSQTYPLSSTSYTPSVSCAITAIKPNDLYAYETYYNFYSWTTDESFRQTGDGFKYLTDYSKVKGREDLYSYGDKIKITRDTTLYPVYIVTVKVTYDNNSSGVNDKSVSYHVIKNAPYKLLSSLPSGWTHGVFGVGYTCKGWERGNLIYKFGAKFSEGFSENTTFYAYWQ